MVDLPTRHFGKYFKLLPFSSNIYGTISSSESGGIGFSLINALELKRKNHQDSTGENKFLKAKILDNFTISSGYDLIKDSFNLDQIQLIGRTTLWKKVNLRFGGRVDPYRYVNGRRTNQYQFEFDNKLGTLKSANSSDTVQI